VGDTGGEFVLGMQSSLEWMSWEWVLPVDDLVAVLSSMNYTVQVRRGDGMRRESKEKLAM
jgi:hypothetical protein